MTEYIQQDTIAHVEGLISIASCPAGSAGSFTIIARVRDESGEMKSIEVGKTWQRDDTEDHKFDHDFPIGENTELMTVRLRSLDCTCAETAASQIVAAPDSAAAPVNPATSDSAAAPNIAATEASPE